MILHFFITFILVLVLLKLFSINFESYWTIFYFTLVISILNGFIKKIIEFLTWPINILTLGLFSFIINFIFFLLLSLLASQFLSIGIIKALLFTLVLSLIQMILHKILENNN